MRTLKIMPRNLNDIVGSRIRLRYCAHEGANKHLKIICNCGKGWVRSEHPQLPPNACSTTIYNDDISVFIRDMGRFGLIFSLF
jgi:hypothetical protein